MREQLINHDKRVKHLDHSQIIALLGRITKFLETTEKSTSKTYIYNSPLELVAVQFELINLATHALDLCDWV